MSNQRTITISEEAFQFVQDLVHKMETQDRRATADPYYYVVQETGWTYVPDGLGDETVYLDMENDIVYTKEDLEADGLDQDNFKAMERQREDYFGSHMNFFLTEEACLKYIEENKHNLNCPRAYVLHAFRNPEVKKLYSLLKELVKP